MKTIKTISIFFLSAITFLPFGISQSNSCKLKGKIIGRDSKEIQIYSGTESPRGEKEIINIIGDTFEYELKYDHPQAYQLVFKEEKDEGIWKSIIFFPEGDEIHFTLHPSDDSDKNIIAGSKFNKEFKDFMQKVEDLFKDQFYGIDEKLGVLFDEEAFFSDTAKILKKRIKSAAQEDKKDLYNQLYKLSKGHLDKSPEARVLALKGDSIQKEAFLFSLNYIDRYSSLVSYYILYQELRTFKQSEFDLLEVADFRKRYLSLAEKYPDHPYTSLIGQMIESYEAVKVEEPYIDFEAPKLDGEIVKLSEKIEGKLAVLDLWASWCGPCISKSRKLIPIYDEYKNKGFTIVGVAREFKTTKNFEIALEREKFPWLNLIELDDQQEIWLKYNIPYSGGRIFLIDEKGKIIAVDPTAEEVTKAIEANLSKSSSH